MVKWKKRPLSPMKKLIAQIRKTSEYKKWKTRILKEQCPTYPKVKKFTQVHHLEHISKIIKRCNITSIDQAIKCKELWKAKGLVLSRGEHSIVHRMERIKYPTKGFVFLLAQELKRFKESL